MAGAKSGGGRKSKPPVFLCGVEKELCTGPLCAVSAAMGGKRKAHGSSIEAFKCMQQSLLRTGWEQISPREFRSPDGGPIRVLTKQSRFGAKLRNGKEGTRNMPQGNRGGVIASC